MIFEQIIQQAASSPDNMQCHNIRYNFPAEASVDALGPSDNGKTNNLKGILLIVMSG